MKCLILILTAFVVIVHGGHKNCHKELREAKCKKNNCDIENVKKCYEKILGSEWESKILPKELSKKYKIDDVIQCEAKGYNHCSMLKCSPRKEIIKCFNDKFGKEMANDLIKHIKQRRVSELKKNKDEKNHKQNLEAERKLAEKNVKDEMFKYDKRKEPYD
jgi:hypothetical protein